NHSNLLCEEGTRTMNYKKFLVLAIIFYISSCLPAQFLVPEGERQVYADTKKEFDVKEIDTRIMQKHMGRLDVFIKWLDVAIQIESWDKIALYTKSVKSLCELLLSANIDTSNIPQDFFEIDLKLQESRDFLIEASEKKDIQAMREEFKRLKNTCKQCHAKYRKDFKGGR
ncbi:MAG: cytochrome c, partial [Candidatus Brocadiales bacterium]